MKFFKVLTIFLIISSAQAADLKLGRYEGVDPEDGKACSIVVEKIITNESAIRRHFWYQLSTWMDVKDLPKSIFKISDAGLKKSRVVSCAASYPNSCLDQRSVNPMSWAIRIYLNADNTPRYYGFRSIFHFYHCDQLKYVGDE